MKINKINEKQKFRNTKLFKGLVIGSCALTMASSLGGCSSKEKDVNNLITDEMSFETLLDSVSDKTNMDEILNEMNYKELLNEYIIARQNKDLDHVCDALYELGKIILKASISDTLINNNSIESYQNLIDVDTEFNANEVNTPIGRHYINYYAYIYVTYTNGNTKTVSGNIEVENDIITKKYEAVGEIFDLIYNMNDCKEKNVDNLDYADKIFKSYEKYLFTTGNIDIDSKNFNYYDYDGYIKNTYDNEKAKVLKK